ncbi:MAG TPA: DUF3592 domain-containing protein [Candidatus Acidoferrum sp.]
MSQSPGLRQFVGIGAVFFGLCTIFVLAVTIIEGRREYAQKSWPAATAMIEHCEVDSRIPPRRHAPIWQIDCRISYLAGAEEVMTRIESRSVNVESGFNQWVSAHRHGSTMAIHYNPQNHQEAVLIETDMPFAGPRTPDNEKLLALAGIAFLIFYAAARVLARRPV